MNKSLLRFATLFFMGKQIPSHIELLKNELLARQRRNLSYSLRAFALALGVDAGYFSKCLSLRQVMSLEIAEKIITKLHLDATQREQFLLSIAEQQKCTVLKKHDDSLTDCKIFFNGEVK